jgi:hypothetical protein
MLRRLIRATMHLSNMRNPLFLLDVRRVRWFHSPESLMDQSVRVFFFTNLALAVLWLLLPGGDSGYGDNELRSLYAMGVMGLSIPAAILLDLRAMLSVSNSISEEFTAGRMDLIRLTELWEGDIVAAKHSLAQVRVWRMTMLVACARLAGVLLTFLTLFVGVSAGSFFEAFRYAPLEVIIGLVSYGLFIVVFVLEPLWRVRAMTALGIAISTRVRNPALAILLGFLAIPAVWITQMVVLGVISWVVLTSLVFVYASLMCMFSYAVVLAVLVYFFYDRLQTWALHHAIRHVFQD